MLRELLWESDLRIATLPPEYNLLDKGAIAGQVRLGFADAVTGDGVERPLLQRTVAPHDPDHADEYRANAEFDLLNQTSDDVLEAMVMPAGAAASIAA